MHDLSRTNQGHVRTNIILIDFENVQPKNLTLLRGHPFKTKIFFGANQTKIAIEIAAELQPLGPDVEYIVIEGTGNNALDFHIAYYIGRLSAELPGSVFHIISGDSGFDPLIKHLKAKDIVCHRVTSLKEALGFARSASVSPQDRIHKIADNLLNRKEARPRTSKTLSAFIAAQLNGHATEASLEEVIALLKQGGISILPDGKVSYPST